MDNKKAGDIILGFELLKPSINATDDGSHAKHASQGDIPYSGPLQVPSSSGFAWARRRLDDSLSARARSRSSSRSLVSEPFRCNENVDRANSRGQESNGLVIKNWNQLDRPESFDAGSDGLVKRMNMVSRKQHGCQSCRADGFGGSKQLSKCVTRTRPRVTRLSKCVKRVGGL